MKNRESRRNQENNGPSDELKRIGWVGDEETGARKPQVASSTVWPYEDDCVGEEQSKTDEE